MHKTAAFLITLALVGPPAIAGSEESTPAPKRAQSTFRVDYVLVEIEAGRRAADRSYSLTLNEGSHAQLRSGTKVPLDLGDKGVQYMDVGLRIGARVWERDGDLALDTEIERSTFATPAPAAGAKGNPSLRSMSQALSSRPTLGQPAVLSKLDDLDGERQLQLEVTVTKLR